MSAPRPIFLRESDVARWRTFLAPVDDRGCRMWTGSTNVDGYGRLTVALEGGGRRRTVSAHLVAWLVEVGAFPVGDGADLEPDHTCVRPACTTVEHLEWVTHAENQRRIAARATHCRTGLHRWDQQDPIVRAGGRRECRPCENAAQRRRRDATTGRGGVVGRPPAAWRRPARV